MINTRYGNVKSGPFLRPPEVVASGRSFGVELWILPTQPASTALPSLSTPGIEKWRNAERWSMLSLGHWRVEGREVGASLAKSSTYQAAAGIGTSWANPGQCIHPLCSVTWFWHWSMFIAVRMGLISWSMKSQSSRICPEYMPHLAGFCLWKLTFRSDIKQIFQKILKAALAFLVLKKGMA